MRIARCFLRSWTFVFAVIPLLQGVAAEPVSPGVKPPLIIPRPKSLHVKDGSFAPGARAKWVLKAGERDEPLWQCAQAALGAGGKFERSGKGSVSLTYGVDPGIAFPAENPPQWATDPEGYRLLVRRNGLIIQASRPQGAFYALQTLAQLRNSTNGGRSWQTVEIQDWPSMRFRGAHWFPSASGLPMHLKLIQNVFGPLKLNESVIQCEAARWDKYPGIAATNSISKAGLSELVKACRSQYIDAIPLVNVPGHAEWIFRNGNNVDIAEDPKALYAYCVNNPKSYEVVENVLSECLPIFGSKYFHLGHDEITMRGKFPNPECPLCKNSTETALVIQHQNRLGEWLKQREVKSMIWGDMLLGPGEAADATHAKSVAEATERRAGIMKGTTIVDWHYAQKSDRRSLDIFKREGFPVVAATFYDPQNIYNFSQAALASGADGLLQTTWMGYFPDERAMKNELRQFTAFVLAAEYAWSGRSEPPSQLGYDAKEVFLDAYAAASSANPSSARTLRTDSASSSR